MVLPKLKEKKEELKIEDIKTSSLNDDLKETRLSFPFYIIKKYYTQMPDL